MNRRLIAGNWKMNGVRADLHTVETVAAALPEVGLFPEALLCVPATLLAEAARKAHGTSLRIGAQTCHQDAKGAFTGDVSAPMIADAGATFVIVGHSERRRFHGETDAIVAGQAVAAQSCGLIPIVCIGETEAERHSGATLDVIRGQLQGSLAGLRRDSGLVLAYEPLWAIGTGNFASATQIAEVHDFISNWLVTTADSRAAECRVLYGGSLNPSNAAEILAISNVDGGLIGGASLKAADFLAIYETARALSG